MATRPPDASKPQPEPKRPSSKRPTSSAIRGGAKAGAKTTVTSAKKPDGPKPKDGAGACDPFDDIHGTECRKAEHLR